MRFGSEPVSEAAGALLAHSVQAGTRKLRKGLVLGAEEIAALQAAGITEVTTARLEPGDVAEDEAATQVARALVPDGQGVRITRPQNGRVNLLADRPGVLRLDVGAIHALNGIDPAITLATLPDNTRVSDGMMLATVKIIPYAVPGAAVARAAHGLGNAPVISVAPTVLHEAELVITRTPGFSDKLIDKGRRAVADRLAALGVRLLRDEVVPHETRAVAEALGRSTAPLVLVLGASATSDAGDVCPAGLVAAGGELTRFGMPVDPGNLLFLGRRGAAQVVGLPGCARSPALNGADWVLERLVCGIEVGDADIAAMGVGGLLKEIPVRPQPRTIAPVPRTDGQAAWCRAGQRRILTRTLADLSLRSLWQSRRFGKWTERSSQRASRSLRARCGWMAVSTSPRSTRDAYRAGPPMRVSSSSPRREADPMGPRWVAMARYT